VFVGYFVLMIGFMMIQTQVQVQVHAATVTLQQYTGTVSHRNYNVSENSRWILKTPSEYPGSIMRIKFTFFDIEDQGACSWDSITLYHGESEVSSNLIQTLCGEVQADSSKYFHNSFGTQFQLNFFFISKESSMLVLFKSDSVVNKLGFDFTYSVKAPVPSASSTALGPFIFGSSETKVVSIGQNLFTNPSSDADPFTYTFTLNPSGSALPSWAVYESATSTMTLNPTSSDVGTYSFQIKGTNKYNYFATRNFSVEVRQTEVPDSTSVLQCETLEVDTSYSSVVSTPNIYVGNSAMPSIWCRIFAKKGGATIYTTADQFTASITSGAGAVQPAISAAGDYATEFRIRFDPAASGGPATISDGVSSNTQTVVVYAMPDYTSSISCDSPTVITNQNVECTVTTRINYVKCFTRYTGGALGGGGVGYINFNNFVLAPATITNPTANTTAYAVTAPGSEFPIVINVGTVLGTVNVLVGTSPYVLTVVDTPDTTSRITCYPTYLVAGAESSCAILPRKSHVSIYSKSTHFTIGQLPNVLGSISEIDPPFGTMLNFTLTANTTLDTTSLQLKVDGNAVPVLVPITVSAAPDSTSVMSCGSGNVRIGNSIICEITAKKASAALPVVNTAFTLSALPSSGHTLGHLRPYRDLNSGVLAQSYTAQQFEFTFTAGSSSELVTLSDGVSTSQEMMITNDPDASSMVTCDNAVIEGLQTSCTIATQRGTQTVYAQAGQLAITITSGSGTVGDVTNDEGTMTPSSQFKFAFTAPTGYYGTVQFRLDITFIGTDPAPGNWAYGQIIIAGEPDSTSTINCRTTTVSISTPVRCWVTPKKAGSVIYAYNNRFTIEVEGEGTVSDFTTDVSNNFVFEYTSGQAFTTQTLKLKLMQTQIQSIVLTATPPGKLKQWSSSSVMFFDSTDPISLSVAAGSISFGREAIKSSFARTINEFSYYGANTITFGATEPSNSVITSISCAKTYCAMCNSVGDVYTFGESDQVKLAREGDSTSATRITADGIANEWVQQVAVLDDSSNSTALARTSSGDLFYWGLGSGTVRQWSGFSNITTMCSKGDFMMIATSSGDVYSWGTSTSEYYLGRGGLYSTPLKLSLPSSVSGITTLVCGFQYGLIHTTAGEVYSWGYALYSTALPGGSVPTLYTVPSSSPLHGKTITAIDGGASALLAISSEGYLYQLNLWPSQVQNEVRDWSRMVLDSKSKSLESSVFTKISAGTPVLLASDNKGNTYKWQVDSGYCVSNCGKSKQGDVGTTMEEISLNGEPGQVSVLYSYFHQFIGETAPTLVIDPVNGDDGDCGTDHFLCATIGGAFSNFKSLSGVTLKLVDGVHAVSAVSVTVQDIIITSESSNRAAAIIDCGGNFCFELSESGFQLKHLTVRNANQSVSDGGAFKVTSGNNVIIEDVVFSSCSSTGSGGAIAVLGGSAFITNSKFESCTAQVLGGAITVKDSGKLSVTGCEFISNTVTGMSGSASTGRGGSIGVQIASSVDVSTSTFMSCSSAWMGGAMYFERASTMSLTSVVSSNNTASHGAGLAILDSTVTISSCQFISNEAVSYGGGVYIEYSITDIVNSVFKLNKAYHSDSKSKASGGGLSVIGDRRADISGTTFDRNYAKNSGGGIYAVYTRPSISTSTLFGNTAISGGAVALFDSASITSSDNTYDSNYVSSSGAVAYFEDALESTFLRDTFVDNSASVTTGKGGVVYAMQGTDITFTACTATRNKAAAGGVVYWIERSPISIAGVTQNQNEAQYGTGVASAPQSFVWGITLPGSYKATSGSTIDATMSVKLVDYYNQVVKTDSSSALSIVSQSGHDLVGSTLGVLNQGEFTFANSTAFGVTAPPAGTSTITVQLTVQDVGTLFVSNQVIQIRACVAGERDTGLACQVCPIASYSNTNGATVCDPCDPGTYNGNTGATECEVCPAGSATNQPGQSSCALCDKGKYTNVTGSRNCISCPGGYYAEDTGSTTCLQCPAGTSASAGSSKCTTCIDGTIAESAGSDVCVPCHSNSLSVNATECLCQIGYYEVSSSSSVSCDTCPTGADCTVIGTEKSSVLPLEGYWPALNSLNSEFLTCLNDACLGSSPAGGRSLSSPICTEGYTGHLCSECDVGFGRTGEYDCTACPSQSVNRARLAGAAIAIVVVCAGFIYSTIKSALQKKGLHAILLKILLSCLQFNSIAASFQFEWPGVVRRLLEAQQAGSNVGSSLLSVDCFLDDTNTTSPFFIKSLVFMFVPVIAAILPLLVLAPLALYWKSKGRSDWRSTAKEYYIISVIVALFVIHPSISQQTLQMFSCKRLGTDGGDLYLMMDMSQKCFSSSHMAWIFTVALPCVALYVIGIPALGFRILHRNRYRLGTTAVQQRYSFLYRGYQHKWYFWEIVVVARKVLLVCIAVFFTYNIHVQALMAVFLVCGCLMAHIYARPYEEVRLDWMEFFSLVVSFSTFWCGLFLFVEELSYTDKVILSIVIVLANVAFAAVAVYLVVKFYLEARRQKKLEKEMGMVGKDVEDLEGDQDSNDPNDNRKNDGGGGTQSRQSKQSRLSKRLQYATDDSNMSIERNPSLELPDMGGGDGGRSNIEMQPTAAGPGPAPTTDYPRYEDRVPTISIDTGRISGNTSPRGPHLQPIGNASPASPASPASAGHAGLMSGVDASSAPSSPMFRPSQANPSLSHPVPQFVDAGMDDDLSVEEENCNSNDSTRSRVDPTPPGSIAY
jgi:predicted outer membrane repeat protein